MGSTPKALGILMTFLLVIGLSVAVQAASMPSAADDKKADQSETTDGQMQKTIQGDVIRIDGNNYVIEGVDGKEVKLYTDNNTVMSDQIFPRDRIEAKITEKNQALSMFPIFRVAP
ncbi:MAG TPA: hypothetical protein VIJ87_10165 [Pyrinomonadaceae bacterium]